ncbi:DUF1156 domain-containing protein [Demequina rhizosphaerae]|uniref:DUF1156 domain-containing protein n=1 Tax=Demequina rhizosphaerae TaxID=1638985 RepID=UPI000783B883|nr:DUF1156 domain-containing protein [Demequina rhizosphaerae]
MTDAPKRKLIEVSLPLEDINRESAREKSIRHGHPSTLHLWWARRPLAAARAVLFAQLVDDPSAHPDEFPTEEAQAVERERLHDIIRELVKWENINNEALYKVARAEIMKSTDGNPPPILDPFAGGGTIPLEAQRLGLEAHASDLNPVAVLINKALIEIPPKFAGQPPIFPGAAGDKLGDWPRATGLAEDVRRYGEWMRDRAEERIGHLYPKVTLADGSEAPVIAWIWARTVRCPNPACGIEMPLVRSWWLSKKQGKEAYVVPEVVADATGPSGKRVAYAIGKGKDGAPTADTDGTVGRQGAMCVSCAANVDLKYVRAEGRAGRLDQQLMAVVASGDRSRVYVAPNSLHVAAADMPKPTTSPISDIPEKAPSFRVQAYGMTHHADLFTHRQLTALTTFSDLVSEARDMVLADALAGGLEPGARLEAGGASAEAYADAVVTYLGLAVSTLADDHSSIVSWRSSHGTGATRATFARQALPMVWDFAEANPFSGTAGDPKLTVEGEANILDRLPEATFVARADQQDAASRDYSNVLVSTDPPYYDNIGYSDLSDFFYVWLRRSLAPIHPGLLSTMLVPKAEELVANAYRHGGADGAAAFFETGFERVFASARADATGDYPIAVYYAFKQQELEQEGIASTGWATVLEGMIRGGWAITATWPVRSERAGRMIAVGTNALASSIVLALRPRGDAALAVSRGGFINALKKELPRALDEMQQGAIAPVDLAQATIGPGMAVFSRYARVIDSDGSRMSVKTALALINQALDEVLQEQDGNLDSDSRFCVKWYEQYGWEAKPYGEADVLARAVNVSVDGLVRGGVLSGAGSKVQLIKPADMDPAWDPATDDRTSVWEAVVQLCRALDSEGIEAAAALMAKIKGRTDLDDVRGLAYRLYEIAQSGRTDDAILFNNLATAWIDIKHGADKAPAERAAQDAFDFAALAEGDE